MANPNTKRKNTEKAKNLRQIAQKKGTFSKKKLLFSLLALLLLASLTVGAVHLATAERTVMRAGDVKLKEDLYAYFLLYYRYDYRVRLAEGGTTDAIDDPLFWESCAEDGETTHDEAARQYAERMMAKTIAAAEIFEGAGLTLTKSERRSMNDALDDLLARTGCEGRADFNRLAKKYGFSYSTVRRALLYVAEAKKVFALLAGTEGELLGDSTLEEYYEGHFRRILILEVWTERKHKTNAEGKLVYDDYGEPVYVEMSAEEKQAQRERIAEIAASLAADGRIENFEVLHEQYNQDVMQDDYRDGYYFDPASAYTDHFAEQNGEEGDTICNAIFALEQGGYTRLDLEGRTLFLFRTGTTTTPYADLLEGQAEYEFFHDMRQNAASWATERALSEAAAHVETDRAIADAITSPLAENDTDAITIVSFFLPGISVYYVER